MPAHSFPRGRKQPQIIQNLKVDFARYGLYPRCIQPCDRRAAEDGHVKAGGNADTGDAPGEKGNNSRNIRIIT
jgi:hypothetical protein